MLYNRYSQIVYEGDSVNIFGVMTYNTLTDSWEITKSICYMKEFCLGDYLSSVTWDQVWTSLGLTVRGVVLGFCAYGFFKVGSALIRRARNRVMRQYQAALQA